MNDNDVILQINRYNGSILFFLEDTMSRKSSGMWVRVIRGFVGVFSSYEAMQAALSAVKDGVGPEEAITWVGGGVAVKHGTDGWRVDGSYNPPHPNQFEIDGAISKIEKLEAEWRAASVRADWGEFERIENEIMNIREKYNIPF